jgi:hypothetical protein
MLVEADETVPEPFPIDSEVKAMDWDIVIAASFLIVMTLIIVGGILVYPISRKLGHLIEANLAEKRAAGLPEAGEAQRLAERLSAVEDQLRTVVERQRFVDELLVGRDPADRLGSGWPGTD